MMLEWEQTTEITTQFFGREFLPSATNQERGVQNLEFECIQRLWFSRVARRTTL